MRSKGFLAMLVVAVCAALGNWGLLTESTAQEKDKLPADLARVPAGSLAFFSVRPAEIWGGEIGKPVRAKMGKDAKALTEELEKVLGVDVADIERLTVAMVEENEMPLLVLQTKTYDRKKVLTSFVPGAKEEKIKEGTIFVKDRQAVAFLSDTLFLAGGAESVKSALKGGTPKGPMAEALALAGEKHSAVIAVNVAEVVRHIPGGLPTEVEPFKPLFKAKSVTATIDLGAKSAVTARALFANEEDAKGAEKPLRALVDLAKGGLDAFVKELSKDKELTAIVDLLKGIQESLKAAHPKLSGKELTWAAKTKIDVDTLAAQGVLAVAKVRQAAMRSQSANNLKQIGIAMHNYHDTTGNFPAAAVYGKDGKPLLSWRVLILPYIEQDGLYKQFKLNEPWDSEHNKKLLAKLPKVYADPSGKTDVKYGTYYQCFTGKGTVFEGKKGIRFTDIADGTSNTLMIVEAGKAVPWSKPEDLPYADAAPVPAVGGIFPGGFNALFCDGSVRFLPKTLQGKTFRALITRNGGEAIGDIE